MKLPEISKQVLYYKMFIDSSYEVISKIVLLHLIVRMHQTFPKKTFTGETGLSEFCSIQ